MFKSSTQRSVTIEGKIMKVGDVVGFKCDTEQYAPIQKITRSAFGGVFVTVIAETYDEDGYSEDASNIDISASDCWID